MKKLIAALLGCLSFIAFEGAYAATDCSTISDKYKSGMVTGVSVGGEWAGKNDPEIIRFWFKAKGADSESQYVVYPRTLETVGKAMYAQLAAAFALQIPARIEACLWSAYDNVYAVSGMSIADSYGN